MWLPQSDRSGKKWMKQICTAVPGVTISLYGNFSTIRNQYRQGILRDESQGRKVARMYPNYRPQWVWGQRLNPVSIYRNMYLGRTQIRFTEPFGIRSFRIRVFWLILRFYSIGTLVAAWVLERCVHLPIAKFHSSIRNRLRPWMVHSADSGLPGAPLGWAFLRRPVSGRLEKLPKHNRNTDHCHGAAVWRRKLN